jgi:hypothetical protein
VACSNSTELIFATKPKKRTLSRFRRLKFHFHEKLELFSLQNKTKMNKIGDHDLFLIFLFFLQNAGLARHQKNHNPKVVAIFINIGKTVTL